MKVWSDAYYYNHFGYKDDEKMYLGQSLSDEKRFGWAGHDKDGGHYSVASE